MIITNCAACAAPLAHDSPRCVRCKTRYCNSTCQHDHWRRGHKQICKRIHRGGNAEQYHAEKKYKEAVAEAIEKCADDTKGQTCYICTEPVHWKTNEGLVRGCACRGTAGFAHVSCLAEQAKILWEEAEANNLDLKVKEAGWRRWDTCSLCEQKYHGVVQHALGWACWKTCVGRPETEQVRRWAMNMLGHGLFDAKHHDDALSVREAELSMYRRIGAPEGRMLDVQSNLAASYQESGRLGESLPMYRDVHSGRAKLSGEANRSTLIAGYNYANALIVAQRFGEAKSLMRKTMPVARRALGEGHNLTLKMRWKYAEALYKYDSATLGDLHEAATTLEDTARTARRVFGSAHPLANGIEECLQSARVALHARETPPASA